MLAATITEKGAEVVETATGIDPLAKLRADESACPKPTTPDDLVAQLTGIKVAGVSVISQQEATNLAKSMIKTVRCSAEAGAKKIIVPVLIVSSAISFLSIGLGYYLSTSKSSSR